MTSYGITAPVIIDLVVQVHAEDVALIGIGATVIVFHPAIVLD
ncbi:MAG TPA: hypothetical protein VI479_20385 [Blastocatellia bacterium]